MMKKKSLFQFILKGVGRLDFLKTGLMQNSKLLIIQVCEGHKVDEKTGLVQNTKPGKGNE